MSALLRITLSTIPFLASIVLGWDYLTDAVAQGSNYLVRGWWASLMGAFVIAMAAWIPLAGAVGSILIASVIRLRPPALVGPVADRWLLLYGPAVFVAASWATWNAMWRILTPVATEYARYDAAYFWTTALVGLSLAVGTGAYVSAVVLRGARLPAGATPGAA